MQRLCPGFDPDIALPVHCSEFSANPHIMTIMAFKFYGKMIKKI